MQEQNIIGLPNLDTPVFRIFTVKRLREVFDDKALALVKPEVWDDPYENFLLNAPVRLGDGTIATMKSIADKLYGQCWTVLEESDALWRIYAPMKDGVRVKTTVRKLWNAFYNRSTRFAELNYWMGRMEYLGDDEIEKFMASNIAFATALDNTGKGQAMSLLIKRPAFRHEEEVRLIFNDTEENTVGGLFRASIDPLTLFDELAFDPRMEPGCAECFGREFVARGFAGKTTKSLLYRKPSFTLNG